MDVTGAPLGEAERGDMTSSSLFLSLQNSVKVMYKCLWPSCGKVLRSIVGIKRHVKALHLGWVCTQSSSV